MDCPAPKRGDLLETNLGNRRQRTWFILSARPLRATVRTFAIKAVRWWELEPETRMALYRSAERRGGQEVFWSVRDKPKRKTRFEELMRRESQS
ncbi:MAG TPA: hypothetical protein VFW94_23835 [Candidatus Acidoferrales bacterium]|nr:hypothetical protein [Candidatus Acidoferrales bacterium]